LQRHRGRQRNLCDVVRIGDGCGISGADVGRFQPEALEKMQTRGGERAFLGFHAQEMAWLRGAAAMLIETTGERTQACLAVVGIHAIEEPHAVVGVQAPRREDLQTARIVVEDWKDEAAQSRLAGIIEGGAAAEDQQHKHQPASQ
jgi:hypothetical protein